MSKVDENLWHVQLPWGTVRKMTLSELDAAFNEGLIDANTRVLEDGKLEWSTLREAAGLEDDEVVPASCPSTSQEPALIDMPSVRPMAVEIELGELDEFCPRSRGKGWTFLAVALVLVGVGFAGHGLGLLEARKGITTPFATAVAASRPPRTWESSSAQVVLVSPPTPPALDCANCPQNLSEAQKKALAEAAEKRAAKKSRVAQPAKNTSKAKGPFREGGEPFDPLNSKI
jgi:hypothetical protein